MHVQLRHSCPSAQQCAIILFSPAHRTYRAHFSFCFVLHSYICQKQRAHSVSIYLVIFPSFSAESCAQCGHVFFVYVFHFVGSRDAPRGQGATVFTSWGVLGRTKYIIFFCKELLQTVRETLGKLVKFGVVSDRYDRG